MDYEPKKLWIYPRNWPEAPRGYTFLVPAIERIGGHLFGEAWRNDGFLFEEVSLPEIMSEASPKSRQHAHSILQQLHGDSYRPDYEDNGWTHPQGSLAALGQLGTEPRRIQLGEPSGRDDGYWFTSAQWDEVRAYFHNLNEKHRPLIDMARDVSRWLSHEIADRNIRALVHRVDGRKLEESRPEDWYLLDIEKRRRRIRWSRMLPGDAASESGSHFIFVNAADLEAALDAGDRHREKTTSEFAGVFADSISVEAGENDRVSHGEPALDVETGPASPEVVISTGSAGRPSSMHIVLREVERRVAAGEAAPDSKAALAKEMAAWLSNTYGTQIPKLGVKGMTNSPEFSAAHRNWKGPQSKA